MAKVKLNSAQLDQVVGGVSTKTFNTCNNQYNQNNKYNQNNQNNQTVTDSNPLENLNLLDPTKPLDVKLGYSSKTLKELDDDGD